MHNRKNHIVIYSVFILLLVIGAGTCKLENTEKDDSESLTGGLVAQLVWEERIQAGELNSKNPRVLDTIPAEVVTIRAIISASDMANIEEDFPVAAGEGVIDNVPIGTNRILTMQGLNSTGAAIYQGVATSITVAAGEIADAGTITMVPYDGAEITAFSFTATANSELSSDVTATINNTNITATVPSGTDVTALVATFTITGATVSIGNVVQESGVTENDFTNPVTYTVAAYDSITSQDYFISVVVTSSSGSLFGTAIFGQDRF